MIQKIFKKFRDNFPVKFNQKKENYLKPNNLVKENLNNKIKILKVDGNQFDINSLDKESQNIVKLYEISNMKIQFFENLIKQMKENRKLKIIELKSKLKEENSMS